LALTLQNDFLAIGRLIEDNRNDFDQLASYLNRLIAALSRYFHDDKLIMFDREGLIRFINERADTEGDASPKKENDHADESDSRRSLG
jgi:hypothetical protein